MHIYLKVLIPVFAVALGNSVMASDLPSVCMREVGTPLPPNGTIVKSSPEANFVIAPGDCIVSTNRSIFLAMQADDGNLVVYPVQGASPATAKYASKTSGNPKASLLVQNDGRLVIYKDGGIINSNGNPASHIWARGASVRPLANYFLAVQDDGNVVLYKGTDFANANSIWSYREEIELKSYCAVFSQGDGNVVGKNNITAYNPTEAEAAGKTALKNHNARSLPQFRGSRVRVSLGKC